MWATELRATKLLRSTCWSIAREDKINVVRLRARLKGISTSPPSQNKAIRMLVTPKIANFKTTPANRIDPSNGASV
jgi:hypothetical protein